MKQMQIGVGLKEGKKKWKKGFLRLKKAPPKVDVFIILWGAKF